MSAKFIPLLYQAQVLTFPSAFHLTVEAQTEIFVACVVGAREANSERRIQICDLLSFTIQQSDVKDHFTQS